MPKPNAPNDLRGIFVANLASRIAAAIRKTGIKQYDLAERAGVSTATISDIVRGRCEPRASTLAAIAQVFGVKVSELTGDMKMQKLSKATKIGIAWKGERR